MPFPAGADLEPDLDRCPGLTMTPKRADAHSVWKGQLLFPFVTTIFAEETYPSILPRDTDLYWVLS